MVVRSPRGPLPDTLRRSRSVGPCGNDEGFVDHVAAQCGRRARIVLIKSIVKLGVLVATAYMDEAQRFDWLMVLNALFAASLHRSAGEGMGL